ncbi:hypothetical protein KBD61_01725 [Patescibacteria group bacterium]|nr:hypothetical protein [Patescibacteria group bacterium]MBP9709729.1 hypothetical protein [Patescibacteria group bacterium]
MIRSLFTKGWDLFRTRRVLVVCFLVSGLVQVSIVGYMAYKGLTPSPRYDGTEYRILAQNLLQHGTFSTSPAPPLLPELLRTPGYPLLLAATYLIEPKGYLMLFLHVIGRLSIGWMIYRLCRRWLGLPYWIATLVTSFWLFDTYTIFIGLQTFSDTAFSFLVCLSFYLALVAPQQRRTLYLSPLLLGFAILVRPQGLALLPCLLAVFFFQSVRSPKQWLILFLSALSIPMIWIGRNTLQVGTPILSSTREYNTVLGIGNADHTYRGQLAEAHREHILPAVDLGDGKAPFRNNWLYTTEGYPALRGVFDQVTREYGWKKSFLLYLRQTPRIWYGTTQITVFDSLEHYYTPIVRQILFAVDIVYVLFLASLGLVGLAFSLRTIREQRPRLLLCFALGIMLASFVNAGIVVHRVRTPLLPFALLLCAYGLSRVTRQARSPLYATSLSTPAQMESEDSTTTTAL